MTALDRLIDAYHASFANSDCQDPDPLLIEAARQEQAELVAVLRKISALGHALAGDTPIVPGSTTDVIDALLSRFPSEPTP